MRRPILKGKRNDDYHAWEHEANERGEWPANFIFCKAVISGQAIYGSKPQLRVARSGIRIREKFLSLWIQAHLDNEAHTPKTITCTFNVFRSMEKGIH